MKFQSTISARLAAGTMIGLFLGVGLTSCAFMNPEKRPFVNFMNRRIEPESFWTKVGLIPIMTPIGTLALAGDAALFYPISQVGPAVRSTRQTYWGESELDPGLEGALFIPKTLIAIPDFLFYWSMRAFLDIQTDEAEEPVEDSE